MKPSCSDSVARRFVFLWHEVPAGAERPSHYDMMFERADGLRTWAVETLPSEDGKRTRAQALPLHRADYLEYEGEVSGDRGRVTRVAAGEYETVVERPEHVVFDLRTRLWLKTRKFRSRSDFSMSPLPQSVRADHGSQVDRSLRECFGGGGNGKGQTGFQTEPRPYRARLIFTRLVPVTRSDQLLADADWEVCLESPSSRGTGNSEAR